MMAPKRSISKTGDNLIEKLHNDVYKEIDPSIVRLKATFVICVIGASRGIGAAVAKAFATAGASTIILAARSTDQLQGVAEEIKQINSDAKIETRACDVVSASSIAELASGIEQEAGRLDALIYNSGFSGPVVLRITEDDPADFGRAFAVNSVGTYLAAHYFIPLLLKSTNGAKMFLAVGSAAA